MELLYTKHQIKVRCHSGTPRLLFGPKTQSRDSPDQRWLDSCWAV